MREYVPEMQGLVSAAMHASVCARRTGCRRLGPLPAHERTRQRVSGRRAGERRAACRQWPGHARARQPRARRLLFARRRAPPPPAALGNLDRHAVDVHALRFRLERPHRLRPRGLRGRTRSRRQRQCVAQHRPSQPGAPLPWGCATRPRSYGRATSWCPSRLCAQMPASPRRMCSPISRMPTDGTTTHTCATTSAWSSSRATRPKGRRCRTRVSTTRAPAMATAAALHRGALLCDLQGPRGAGGGQRQASRVEKRERGPTRHRMLYE